MSLQPLRNAKLNIVLLVILIALLFFWHFRNLGRRLVREHEQKTKTEEQIP